ncbi:MAG: hypothetical protein WCP12_09720 [bacterium]
MTRGTIIVRNCSTCGKYIMQQNIGSGITSHSLLWTDGKRKGPHLPEVAWLMLVKCPHCSALLWIEEQEEVCEIDPWGPDCSLPDKVKIIKKGYEPSSEEYANYKRAGFREKKGEQYAQIRAWIAKNELTSEDGENDATGETAPKEEPCEITDTFKDARLVSAPTFTEFITFLSTGVFDSEKERYIRLHAWWAGNDLRREGGQASPMTQAEKTNLRALLTFLDEPCDGDRLMKAEGFRELGAFAAAEKLLATRFDDRMRKPVKFIRDLCRTESTSVEEIP